MYIMIEYSLAIHYAAPLSTGPLTAAVRARTSRTRYLFKRSCTHDSCNTPFHVRPYIHIRKRPNPREAKRYDAHGTRGNMR